MTLRSLKRQVDGMRQGVGPAPCQCERCRLEELTDAEVEQRIRELEARLPRGPAPRDEAREKTP
jgi:hypothetical protein